MRCWSSSAMARWPSNGSVSLDRLWILPLAGGTTQATLPWGKLEWVARSRDSLSVPSTRHRSCGTPEALHRELEAELNSTIDPKRESRFAC
jgi:hypothetical protein